MCVGRKWSPCTISALGIYVKYCWELGTFVVSNLVLMLLLTCRICIDSIALKVALPISLLCDISILVKCLYYYYRNATIVQGIALWFPI